MQTITRTDAKEAGLSRYFTGVACKHGHVVERLVSNHLCVRCNVLNNKRLQAPGGSQRANWMEKRRNNVGHKLRNRILTVLRKSNLMANVRGGSAVRDLGCNLAEFRDYISSQFKDEMTWDNHGEWHLDHKVPLASFDLTDRSQFLKACHFTNYQPLWAKDNLVKGARL